jgi:hypothetical protein
MYGAKMDEATELKLLEEMLLVGKDDGIHLDDVEVSTIGTLQFHFHSYQLFIFIFKFNDIIMPCSGVGIFLLKGRVEAQEFPVPPIVGAMPMSSPHSRFYTKFIARLRYVANIQNADWFHLQRADYESALQVVAAAFHSESRAFPLIANRGAPSSFKGTHARTFHK